MPIKAVIVDISGTTLTAADTIQPGMIDFFRWLKTNDLVVFFATNKEREASRLKAVLNVPDNLILTYNKFQAGKGSKKFVAHVCNTVGIQSNELVYLGDDKKDMQEAVNSDVIFFLASWSNPTYPYGIPVDSPAQFQAILETFFLKDTLWYYEVNHQDSLNRDVVVRTLLDPDKSRAAGITDFLKSKGLRGNTNIKGFSSGEYLSLHLLASVYLEGLHLRGKRPIWCMYPGSDGGYVSALSQFAQMGARLFHDTFIQDLVQRHTPTPKSSRLRANGLPVTIDTQLQTICLKPEYATKINGRPVIVMDDFTTSGYAFETSRNYLLNAGASSVICIAVGKYPRPHSARAPHNSIKWDSFSPANLTGAQFQAATMPETTDPKALSMF